MVRPSSQAPRHHEHWRHYNEKEIAAIFRQAAADQESAQRNLPHSGGLILAEITQIGKEAGITPAFIARAAAAVDQTTPAPPPTTFLGFPVSVARTVNLPGVFSDEDWDRLVVDLRETFQAPGEVLRDGSLRQWRNGNLHVLVEPTEAGNRLRFRTLSENLKGGSWAACSFLVMGLFLMLLVAAKAEFLVDMGKTMLVAMFALAGLGGMGVTAYRLPRWRAERDGLEIRCVRGDMADLSAFPDGAFDLVFHPVCNLFVPDVLPVWRECYRVLGAGGRLLSGFMNPAFFLFDHESEEEPLAARFQLPYREPESLSEAGRAAVEEGGRALEFGHSLEAQIGGQLAAGFLLRDLYEDDWSDAATPLNRFMPTSIATWAEKRDL